MNVVANMMGVGGALFAAATSVQTAQGYVVLGVSGAAALAFVYRTTRRTESAIVAVEKYFIKPGLDGKTLVDIVKETHTMATHTDTVVSDLDERVTRIETESKRRREEYT